MAAVAAPVHAWASPARPKLCGEQLAKPLRQQHLWSSVLRWPQPGQKVAPQQQEDLEDMSCGSSRRPSEQDTSCGGSRRPSEQSADTSCGSSRRPSGRSDQSCEEDEPATAREYHLKVPTDSFFETASTTCSALSSRAGSRANSRPTSAVSTKSAFDLVGAMCRLRQVAVGRQRGARASRFSRQALAQLWASVDADGSGGVSQRELATRLKENSDLREMMYLLAARPVGPARELPSDERHKMTREVKEIIREVEWDAARQLTWVGFVHTFQKHGMFAE